MSGLSDDDREAICVCAELSVLLSHDLVKAACEAREAAVEAIVARAVNEALTEAADELDARWTRNIGGHPYSDRDRGLLEAARIVRARRTT